MRAKDGMGIGEEKVRVGGKTCEVRMKGEGLRIDGRVATGNKSQE